MIKRLIIIFITIIIVVLFSDFSNGTVNNTKISTLLRQSARWAIASTQDDSAMISLLHANYAAGYLWAVKDIYSDVEIIKFVESGSSFDKSGAYAIQDNDFNPVEIIDGCYTNVLGLPICTMIELFKQHGFIWNSKIMTKSKFADSICSIAESWDMEI